MCEFCTVILANGDDDDVVRNVQSVKLRERTGIINIARQQHTV